MARATVLKVFLHRNTLSKPGNVSDVEKPIPTGQENPMIKVEAIIRPNKFESVKTALIQLGVEGMTVSEVRGHGRQKGHTETFKGREYEVDLLPKIKLELVLEDSIADKAIDSILTTAYTGSIGDGKIFLYNVADAIRIRSRERGVAAV